MSQLLKHTTAATVTVVPVIDADGAVYTGMAAADFYLNKNGTNAGLSGNTVTSLGNGLYTVALTTGNADTLGRLDLSCNKSAYIMPIRSFTVLPADVFDALVNDTGAGINAYVMGMNSGVIVDDTFSADGQIVIATAVQNLTDADMVNFAGGSVGKAILSLVAKVDALALQVAQINTEGGGSSGSTRID